jgi:DNA-binding protein HU-beta
MNKKDLIEIVADTHEISKAEAERIVGTVFATIAKAIKKDGEVSLFGFGSFKLKKRAARMGRNPQTGATVKIKASKTVGFKPATALRAPL